MSGPTALSPDRMTAAERLDEVAEIMAAGVQRLVARKSTRLFSSIDHYVWDRVRRWLRKKFPKTPRMEIHRRYWRRLPGRPRNAWIDQRPIAFVGDIKVGRHNLRLLRYPAYAEPVLESPVHTERCPPGSGAGEEETTGGNPGIGASSPRSLRKHGKLEAAR